MQYKLLTILGLIILGAISAIYWKLDAYQHNLPLTLRSPMTLHTVVSKLPEDAYIRGMDVIEEKERTLTVALKPSHDASDMVNQYAKARKDNYTLLASLLSADATRALDPSLEREATYVRELVKKEFTADTMIIGAVYVNGPRKQVHQFQKNLSFTPINKPTLFILKALKLGRQLLGSD